MWRRKQSDCFYPRPRFGRSRKLFVWASRRKRRINPHGQTAYRWQNTVCQRDYCQWVSRTYGVADWWIGYWTRTKDSRPRTCPNVYCRWNYRWCPFCFWTSWWCPPIWFGSRSNVRFFSENLYGGQDCRTPLWKRNLRNFKIKRIYPPRTSTGSCCLQGLVNQQSRPFRNR